MKGKRSILKSVLISILVDIEKNFMAFTTVSVEEGEVVYYAKHW